MKCYCMTSLGGIYSVGRWLCNPKIFLCKMHWFSRQNSSFLLPYFSFEWVYSHRTLIFLKKMQVFHVIWMNKIVSTNWNQFYDVSQDPIFFHSEHVSFLSSLKWARQLLILHTDFELKLSQLILAQFLLRVFLCCLPPCQQSCFLFMQHCWVHACFRLFSTFYCQSKYLCVAILLVCRGIECTSATTGWWTHNVWLWVPLGMFNSFCRLYQEKDVEPQNKTVSDV